MTCSRLLQESLNATIYRPSTCFTCRGMECVKKFQFCPTKLPVCRENAVGIGDVAKPHSIFLDSTEESIMRSMTNRQSSSSPCVRVIRDFDELRGLREPWNQLVQRLGPLPTWFSFDWYDCWWQAFGTRAELFVPTIWADDGLAAAAPMMILNAKIKGVPCRVLRFMENGITPRSQFIVAGDNRALVVQLWDAIAVAARSWDLAVLANVPQLPPIIDIWEDSLNSSGLASISAPDRQSAYIDLSLGYAAFRQSVSLNMRKNINASRNRLLKMGEVEFESISENDDLGGALETCYAISARSWKAATQTDLGGRPGRRRFYGALVENELLRSRLHIWILRLGGQPIAFEMAVRSDRLVTGLATDYDQTYRQCSPGVYLRARFLEELADSGVDRYDLAGQLYGYKLYWTKHSLPHSQYWVFHGGLKSRGLHFMKARVLPALKRLKRPASPDSADPGAAEQG